MTFDRAFALGRDIETFAASTLPAKRRSLERDLDAVLRAFKMSARERPRGADDLSPGSTPDLALTVLDFPGAIEATNNESKRRLRPRVN